MRKPPTPALASLVLAIGLLLAAAALRAAPGSGAGGPTWWSSPLGTGFEECNQPPGARSQPEALDIKAFRRTLHGVWIGTRIPKSGSVPRANYVLILDMMAQEGMAYEERGSEVDHNGFSDFFPLPASAAPQIQYLHCGGDIYAPFQDVFVKVSPLPRLGTRAVQAITGVDAPGDSVAETWAALVAADFFLIPRGTNILTGSFYNVSLTDQGEAGVRWDMVGEYRGSPQKFVNGQPMPGLEGGLFQGAMNGRIGVGYDLSVACFAEAMQPDILYFKIAVGPIR